MASKEGKPPKYLLLSGPKNDWRETIQQPFSTTREFEKLIEIARNSDHEVFMVFERQGTIVGDYYYVMTREGALEGNTIVWVWEP